MIDFIAIDIQEFKRVCIVLTIVCGYLSDCCGTVEGDCFRVVILMIFVRDYWRR